MEHYENVSACLQIHQLADDNRQAAH